MCTVTIVPYDDGFRLVCNRDERRERPAATAPMVHRLQHGAPIYPVDPVGGGTWVGVNDAGLAAALLNRTIDSTTSPSHAPVRSRGLIIPNLLGCRSLIDALDSAAGLDPTQFDRFRLILVQRMAAVVLTSDELTLSVEFRAVGSAAIPLVVGAILAFWAWRIVQKRRLIRLLRTRRLTPDQLRARLESDDPIRIIDLRAAIEYEVTRQTVPGAIRMDPEELDDRHEEIPRDCDVVLYCSCPNEATSARAALALKRRGIERVFPLEGGLEAWVSCGYPVDVTP